MHPLAHALTGALIGQAASSPAVGLIGGVASHFLLDAIPHAEGETFRDDPAPAIGVEHLEALVELGVAIVGLGWVAARCPAAAPLSLAMGTLGGLLPDLVDFPLHLLFGVAVLHRKPWHRTVPRQRAALGILTQVIVIVVAGAGIWWASGCPAHGLPWYIPR